MTLYDYLCLVCQTRFDLMRPMSEAHDPAVCPRCGSEAQRILASALTSEDLTQAPIEPSSSYPAPGTRASEVGASNAPRQPVGMGPASDLEYRAGSQGGLPGETLRDDMDHRRSAGSITAVAAAAPEEARAADSRVDLPEDTAPLEMPQLTEYQPSGGNLWHIRDWGIASMFGYLRGSRAAEPAAAVEDHQGADQLSPALAETDSDAGAAETADRYPSASEWRIATAVMPWLEEMQRESSESDKETPDITGEETDLPGLKPRRNRPTVHLAWAPSAHTRPAEERGSDAARHPRPVREKTAVDFPDEIVGAAWRRQGGRCAKCGRWLIWAHRDRDSGTGAWESHHRIPANQGGRPTLPNCVLLCSGVADCHFNIGHGGIAWSHYAPLGDSALLFISGGQTTAASPTTPARRKRNLLREVLGIPQTKKD